MARRMPKPRKFTATLAVPDGVFGGSVVATVTMLDGSAIPAHAYVLYTCQAATGGQVGQSLVGPDGTATLTFGPTPSWSSGEASGGAYVQVYDLATGKVVQISDAVAFHVAA